MKAKEYRGFTLDDLKKKSKELVEELFATRLQNINGSLENSAKIRQIRRDVARVKTVMKEKMRGGQQSDGR